MGTMIVTNEVTSGERFCFGNWRG